MRIIIKEVFEKDYISRQAGEQLRLKIVEAIKTKQMLLLDFKDLIVASTSFFDESIAKLSQEDGIAPEVFLEYVTLKDLNKNDKKVLDQVTIYRNFNLHLKHPWRICPLGEHWVKEHPRNTPSGTTSVEGHCRKSPKNKDVIFSDELKSISNQHFKTLSDMPKDDDLQFPNGKKFDELIGGWCKYWNDILSPEQILSPNIVKALIASESGFEVDPPRTKEHTAIGIMQIMPQTLEYLGTNTKELKNHFIEISPEEAKDPSVNIAAGIRWLFRKYDLTKLKLKRKPTWEEVLEDYKGILNDESEKAKKIRLIIDGYLKKLS